MFIEIFSWAAPGVSVIITGSFFLREQVLWIGILNKFEHIFEYLIPYFANNNFDVFY